MSVKTRAIVFVLLVGSALTWNIHLQGQRSSPLAPLWQQMTAQSITVSPTQALQLRGSVRIVQDTAVITADEVDARVAPEGTVEYDLRGNVHLTTRLRK